MDWFVWYLRKEKKVCQKKKNSIHKVDIKFWTLSSSSSSLFFIDRIFRKRNAINMKTKKERKTIFKFIQLISYRIFSFFYSLHPFFELLGYQWKSRTKKAYYRQCVCVCVCMGTKFIDEIIDDERRKKKQNSLWKTKIVNRKK